jgi:hypothetical protein
LGAEEWAYCTSKERQRKGGRELTKMTANPPGMSYGALLCLLETGGGASPVIIETDGTWESAEDHAWDWTGLNSNKSTNRAMGFCVRRLEGLERFWVVGYFAPRRSTFNGW